MKKTTTTSSVMCLCMRVEPPGPPYFSDIMTSNFAQPGFYGVLLSHLSVMTSLHDVATVTPAAVAKDA